MTFPAWIQLGPLRVHPHLVFDLLAYLVAAMAYWYRRHRTNDHISTEDRWALAAAATVGALIGSRVFFWLEDPEQTLAMMSEPLSLVGGQTIVGALIGGWIAVEWQKRRLGISEPTGDLVAIPIALGAGVGRVGCFLSGLEDGTYGLPASLPWAIDLGDGIPRHPAALYESAFFFVLAWMLARTAYAVQRGETFLILMAGYLTFRFGVDFLKPGLKIFAGLTIIQCVAATTLAFTLRLWLKRRRVGELGFVVRSEEN